MILVVDYLVAYELKHRDEPRYAASEYSHANDGTVALPVPMDAAVILDLFGHERKRTEYLSSLCGIDPGSLCLHLVHVSLYETSPCYHGTSI
jgi:hypothetical protein